uniref:Protein disulfide-isomerase-like n=1 Tax=Labrus bergylta TaxID=56723 RepID=A0A3Q3L9M9_9LABR
MRTLLLLGVWALCLCVFVAADTQPKGQEYDLSPEKDEVLQLTKGNFKRALRKYEQLLVYFSAPLTVEGHRVSEAFEGAAAELQGSEVKLAVIDVKNEKNLAEELNATDHTIRLYISGDKHNPVSCPVPQSAASILTWLKRRVGSASDLITDLSQIEAREELTVVGFFKELNQEYIQVFYAAATDLPDVHFAVTQNIEVISKYGLTYDTIFLLKKSKLTQAYKMLPQTAKEELIVFITVYQMDPVTEYTGKILFIWVNVEEPRNGRLMEYFRVRDFEAPLIRLVNLTDHITYHLPSETLDAETIKTFCQSYLEGTAKPKMQSEEIPEGWEEQPVKELVGMTLEEVAFNPNKTVFVLFYLPYSKASHAVFPLWEELAEALKDREDTVIARIDASANVINMSMLGSYPSLCLFPALYAERVVVYTGKRKLKDLIKFIDEEMEEAKKYRVLEDEDRRKYMKALKAEEAKKVQKIKEEL